MLRKIRISLAMICFILVTLLFLDFTGTIHSWFGWLAKVQLLPAILALNLGVVLLLLLVTLFLGRIYCSVICPLGVMQDIVSWINERSNKKKFRFSYSPAKNRLRLIILVIFIAAIIVGAGSFVALLAPYSSYGRIAQNLFAPLYGWGNNLLAYLAQRLNSYAFYETSIWIKSISTFALTVGVFIVIAVMAWRNGRTYCNTICPVGTVLGFLSKYSFYRPVIVSEKCNSCSLCSRKCKASCIDFKNHNIDYSRCVTCMDCIDTCKHGAISYRYGNPFSSAKQSSQVHDRTPQDTSRRTFITGIGFLLGTAAVKSQEKKVDGGLAVILDKEVLKRTTAIVPPGAQSLRNMAVHCTGCQLCVSVCPNQVLRPASSLMTLMQPQSSYERGYCRPECTKCSEVCPTGAIRKISVADKSAIQIGHAVWVSKNCIPLTDGVDCGNCARHCPVGAITMIPSDTNMSDSPKIPVVNEERCIGCGACENLCPSRPFSAIYVEGHENHRII